LSQDQINEWALINHPLFEAQLQKLEAEVEKKGKQSFAGKLLRSIEKITNEVVPNDPSSKVFRQGRTLGPEYKHWRRVVFHQQYRLFFRYDSRMKVIIYVWMNDEDTKRAYASKTDAYRVFQKMLESGYPPGDFAELLKQSGFQN
jgi:toxin YhaV